MKPLVERIVRIVSFILALSLFYAEISPAGEFKTWIPQANGYDLPIYCFNPDRPAAAAFPAVIVAAGVGATQAPQFVDYCRQLAARNFVVVFLDPSNHPEWLAPTPTSWDRGIGYLLGSINQGTVGMRLFFELDWYLDSIRSVVDYVCSCRMVDPSRIAISGFSQPANAALTYASSDPRIKAIVWNYGGWPWIMPYEPLRLPPVQIFHGEDDEVYDVKYAKRLALDLQSNMRNYELNIYPNQGHLFNIYYDIRRGENRWMKPALLDAFEKLIAFLRKALVIPGG